jgi:hypothetical protein
MKSRGQIEAEHTAVATYLGHRAITAPLGPASVRLRELGSVSLAATRLPARKADVLFRLRHHAGTPAFSRLVRAIGGSSAAGGGGSSTAGPGGAQS